MKIPVSHQVIIKISNNLYPVSLQIPVEIPFFLLETQCCSLNASRHGIQGSDSAEASTRFQS